jgi:regulator of PEP synthase PpsR (kinase-PPPase family)
MQQQLLPASESTPIFIISGGAEALGKHVARIALAQFPHNKVEMIVIPLVRQLDQLTDAVNQVAARGGAIIHTMMARRVFRRGGFAVVNVTNKPIEESADEIIALITRWFERKITRGMHQQWDTKGR